MKQLHIYFILTVFILPPVFLIAQNEKSSANSVEKVNGFEKLFESGNYYFAGQPTIEALKYLKAEGVKTVINLRSNDENSDFSKYAFNEEELVKELGISYISIPMKGRDSYSAKTLQQFTDVLKANEGKVLIHCKGAGRVTYVMMAYLIKQHNYTMEEAVEFGKQITYFSPFDGLLGEE